MNALNGRYFRIAHRIATHHVGKGRMVHEFGHHIPRLQHDPSESAHRLLRAAFIVAHRNARNRGKIAVKVADHFSHRNFSRIPCKQVASAFARNAIDPTALLEVKHDVLEEALGNVVTPRQLDNWNWLPSIMLDKSKQSSEGVVGTHRQLHGRTIKQIVIASKAGVAVFGLLIVSFE